MDANDNGIIQKDTLSDSTTGANGDNKNNMDDSSNNGGTSVPDNRNAPELATRDVIVDFLSHDVNNVQQQEDNNEMLESIIATGIIAAVTTNESRNPIKDDAGVIEIQEDGEAFQEIPDETRIGWIEMQELQRQEDQRERQEVEKRMARINKLNANRQVTRQSSGTTPQDVQYFQLCIIAGDDCWGEFINGKDNHEDCSLNHPLCSNCIISLWKTPNAYSMGESLVKGQ
jgi:hypothetical protein